MGDGAWKTQAMVYLAERYERKRVEDGPAAVSDSFGEVVGLAAHCHKEGISCRGYEGWAAWLQGVAWEFCKTRLSEYQAGRLIRE